MPHTETTPLIVGAGPAGLAAGLFLAHHGIETRIIDQAVAPSLTSRALAVNPRTLSLLEQTGVTAAMLERGLKIRTVRFWRNDQPLATLSLNKLQHRYPFMLALSQAATETLLTEALQKFGIRPERNVELLSCLGDVSLQTPTGPQTVKPAWLLAADGAHSVIRKQLELGFDGSSFPELWHLVDVPLRGNLQEDAVHIVLFDDGGFLFLLRVVDDIRTPVKGDPVWRVLGNFADPCSRLIGSTPSGPPIWESQFHIAHRIASQLQKGNVYLAGDAAHIHSPMGARGMNLGIEDAWSFAELMHNKTPEHYGPLRRRLDKSVVKRVELITTMARGQNVVTNHLRRYLLPLVPHIPPLAQQLLRTATGLDHEVGI